MFALLALNFFFGSIPYVEDVDKGEIISTKHFDDALDVDKANFAHCFAAVTQDVYECRHSNDREITFCEGARSNQLYVLNWRGPDAVFYRGENAFAVLHAITAHSAKIMWRSTGGSTVMTTCTIEGNTAFVRGTKN